MCKVPPPTPFGECADHTPRTESLQSPPLSGKANKGVGECIPLSKVSAIFYENKLKKISIVRVQKSVVFLKNPNILRGKYVDVGFF